MELIELNLNQVLLLDKFNFQNPLNNIDYLNRQAALITDLDKRLELLIKATFEIEKFHSFFHFEQSYFHLKLAILYHESEQQKECQEQLELATFQDRMNEQAHSMLTQKLYKTYHRPYTEFTKYVTFATNESTQELDPQGYWILNQNNISDLKTIIEEIRKSHLSYHNEAAKLYLNRALTFHHLGKIELSKNDLIKANNLDNNLLQREYYAHNFIKS